MERLPISGVDVSLRPPTGADDLLLLERRGSDTEIALALIGRLAHADGVSDFTRLPIPDIEALLLRIRQHALGDRIRCDLRCGQQDCRARVELAFSIDAYLHHYQPSKPRQAEPSGEPGWFQLKSEPVQFRIPLACDQLRAAGQPNGGLELQRLCVRPLPAPARSLRKVEAALDSIAPILSRPMEATCAECGAVLAVHFDVIGFVLAELRGEAAFLYEDVRTLAMRFHWSESAILDMPTTRRARYVELAEEAAR